MKFYAILTSIFLLALGGVKEPLCSQTIKKNKRVRFIETPRYIPSYSDTNTLCIKMGFNQYASKEAFLKVNVKDIESISLVYTKFKQSETFNQLNLNAQRVAQLYTVFPELKNNSNIQWYWIAQTDCSNPNECKDFFHGIVIKFKNKQEQDKIRTESHLTNYYANMYLGKTQSSKFMDSLVATGTSSYIKYCDTVVDQVVDKRRKIGGAFPRFYYSKKRMLRKLNKLSLKDGLEFIIDKRGRIQYISNEYGEVEKKFFAYLKTQFFFKPGKYNGMRVGTKITLKLERKASGKAVDFDLMAKPVDQNGKEIFNFFDPTFNETIRCGFIDTSQENWRQNINFTEDVITKVLDRNTQWNNCLVVTDVTHSMSPYLGQFLAWHQLNLSAKSKNHNFVFFNDGDNKPTHVKFIGNTGGYYYINTSNYETLKQTLNKAQMAGTGNTDIPENNIEALLYGLKRNPALKEVIMIADNRSTPRDLSLLKDVKVPIRLILCGTVNSGFNQAYLNMIRKNGGSLHTIEKDLMDLAKLKEGEAIEIQGQKYTIKNGEFK